MQHVRLSRLLTIALSSALALAGAGCGSGSLPYASQAPSRFVPSAGMIYVLTNNDQIQEFAPNAGAGASPLGTFTSSVLRNPTGMAVDGQGRVYVAQAPKIFSFSYASYLGGGSVAPSTTLTAVAGPWGLAIDPGGNLVATDSVNDAVDFFAPGADGNAAPLKVLAGSNTQLSSPYQAAFDGAGNLYVLNTTGNSGSGSVTVYAAASLSGSGTIDAAPTAVITSTASAIGDPKALAVDTAGNVYVGNGADDAIAVFPAGSSGFTPPMALVGGYGTFCTCQALMTVASNNLYVAGWNANDVVIYAPITSSSATPMTTITSASLGQTEGVGVVP
jgi:hypothetical protein